MQVETQVLEEAKPGIANGSVLPADGTDVAAEGEAPASNGHDAVAEPAVKAVPYEVESKARKHGWVPKEEWRGSPEAWRPADEYVRRGEEIYPIMRSNLKRTEQVAEDLKAELARERADNAERFKRLEKMNTLALKNQREQIYSQFEAEKLKAVAEGDTAEYKRIAQEQAKAWHEARVEEPEPAKKDEPKPAEGPSPAQKQVIQDWIERNTWFNTDEILTTAATAEHKRLLKESPGMSLEENLEETVRLVREMIPTKFGLKPKPAVTQPHAAPVEGGARGTNGAGRAKGWNDLPPEARTSGENFIKRDGLFLPDGIAADKATEADIQKARAAYVKQYFED